MTPDNAMVVPSAKTFNMFQQISDKISHLSGIPVAQFDKVTIQNHPKLRDRLGNVVSRG